VRNWKKLGVSFLGTLAIASGALTAALPGTSSAATESLAVNLATTTGAVNYDGEGFLYGLDQTGAVPGDNYLEPLNLTLMRGGGARIAGDGWIGDGYVDGTGFKARISSALAQAKRVTTAPYHAEYVLMLSDLWGADLTQSSSAVYPCNGGNCANWITFIDDVVAAVQADGVNVTYELYNEPNGTNFFPPGIGTQYYQLWNQGFAEIRRLVPTARIEGPAFAAGNPIPNSLYQSWLSTVKAAGTLPNVLSIHLEADGHDPVTAATMLNADLAADSITGVTLSSNEFLPQNEENTAATAWFLDRFAQSGFATAARGEWDTCCTSGDLGTILDHTGGALVPSGQYWAFKAYSDMSGSLVSTTGSGSTAISASEDQSKGRAVALLADIGGFTGTANVAISGFASRTWLESGTSTHVEVVRIHDQAPWPSPQVVFSGNMTVSGGGITVPVTVADGNDAYAIYVTPPGSVTADTTADDTATSGTDHFTYGANWGTATGVSDLYDGTAHWTNTSGASTTFTFTGSEVAIHGVNDVDQGISGFAIDGGQPTYVDDYSPTRIPQAILWSASGLSGGTHTVTITSTGTKNTASSNITVALDYAVVSANNATTDDTATSGTDSFSYGANWGTATGVSDLYDGTAHWSNTAAATTTFTFSGTGAVIYGVKDVDQGISTFSVDGGGVTTVDDHSPSRAAGAALFSVSGLAAGTHAIKVIATGTKDSSSTNVTVTLDYATVS